MINKETNCLVVFLFCTIYSTQRKENADFQICHKKYLRKENYRKMGFFHCIEGNKTAFI